MSAAGCRALAAPLLGLLGLLALGLLAAEPAAAHGRSRSYSRIDLEPGGAQLRLRLSARDLTRIPPERLPRAERPLATRLAANLRVGDASGVCAPLALPREELAAEGWRSFVWRVRCEAGAPRWIESALLADVAPSHLHFARVARVDRVARVAGAAEPAVEVLLAGDERRFELAGAEAPARGSGFLSFVALGAAHIATGYDHLAFVIALLLLAVRLRELVSLVTAFTLAHSVTLGLGVLGWIQAEPAAVEALIGFSIALVAVENSWLLAGRGRWAPLATLAVLGGALVLALRGWGAIAPLTWAGLVLFSGCHFALLARARRPARLRAALAFAFGLVHGLGFAGLLGELALPRARLLPALLGFNLGVELGQLLFVAALWPLLRLLASRAPALHRLGSELASAGIAGLGMFWLVTRGYG